MICPDLNFTIEDSEAVEYAVSPHIAFRLSVTNSGRQTVHSIILKCQIQIEAARRSYHPAEQERMSDLFGEPQRWGTTLRSMLWANTTLVVPGFQKNTVVGIQTPCTFDFNVAATKYLAAVEEGDIPLVFFFNGTVFYEGEGSRLQASQISWEKEASYRMPIRVWREMMDACYPNTAWLCLQREAFDTLYDYKLRHGLTTFEEALRHAIGPKAEAESR
jgi:hypothetical protein